MLCGGMQDWAMAHGSAFTVRNVALNLSVHNWTVYAGSQQLHGLFIALVAHVDMECGQDVRSQSTWQYKLLQMSQLLVCHSVMQDACL